MQREIRKQIDYAVVCVNEFAKLKALSPKAAFLYLYYYKGLEYLKENYEIEHTLSLEDTIEALEIVCEKNGGLLQ